MIYSSVAQILELIEHIKLLSLRDFALLNATYVLPGLIKKTKIESIFFRIIQEVETHSIYNNNFQDVRFSAQIEF